MTPGTEYSPPGTQTVHRGVVTNHHDEPPQDEDFIELCLNDNLNTRSLDSFLDNPWRAVRIRRQVLKSQCASADISASFLESLPHEGVDYRPMVGSCCENTIGYLPVPVGIVGPLIVDNKPVFVPIATTEGNLIANISCGSNVINEAGGAVTCLSEDSMTRAPCVKFPTLARAMDAKDWVESPEGKCALEKALFSTSRVVSLTQVCAFVVGNLLYLRLSASTGDTMGTNMLSLVAEKMLSVMRSSGFEDMTIITVSGNCCAINWVEGRGKSVAAQARIPRTLVKNMLKTTPQALVEFNTANNLIGSAVAGNIGGFNAHASNVVSAIFLATGQDIAQIVESSNCITTMSVYVPQFCDGNELTTIR